MKTKKENVSRDKDTKKEVISSSGLPLNDSNGASQHTTKILIQMGLISDSRTPKTPKLPKSRYFDGDYEPTSTEIREATERQGLEDIVEDEQNSGCLARLFGCWSVSKPTDKDYSFAERSPAYPLTPK